jgi:hypothetical protein
MNNLTTKSVWLMLMPGYSSIVVLPGLVPLIGAGLHDGNIAFKLIIIFQLDRKFR